MKKKLMVVFVLILFVSACKGNVDKVKESVWSGDKGTTIGKALDNYNGFEKKSWESKKSDNGKEYVEFTGDINPSSRLTTLDTENNNIINKKKYVEYYRDKLQNNDKDAIVFWGSCSPDKPEEIKSNPENDKQCIERVKQDSFFGRQYSGENTSALEQKTEDARRHFRDFEQSVNDYNKIKSFYGGGGRLQIVFQFILNQDKSIDILGAGCQTAKGKKNLAVQPAYILPYIYNNQPIDNFCMLLESQ
jgi:hypothetical protein